MNLSTLALLFGAVLLSLRVGPARCEKNHGIVERRGVLERIRKLVGALSRRWKRDDGEPDPVVTEHFLAEEEARLILERYEPLLSSSSSAHVVDSRVRRDDEYRTSKSIRLPPLGDSLVLDVERRAARLAGVPHSLCEDFQLACYEYDGLYGLHRDDTDPVPGSGQRSADRSDTVLVYLRAPEDGEGGGKGGKGGGGGGGETLFTRRPIEDERDMDTGRPLNTQKGALKLFRSYCEKPRRKHLMVTPKVGRAVSWKNWYVDSNNATKFARRSTHGACPVKEGGKRKKCVIQQWMSKSEGSAAAAAAAAPLRDERIAAIFPAGADASYQRRGNNDDDGNGGEGKGEGGDGTSVVSRPLAGEGDAPCFADASARAGSTVPALCFSGGDDGEGGGSDDARLVQRDDDGPYSGVGSLRITGGGALRAAVPADLLTSQGGGLTVSFWVRGSDVGTTLFSLGVSDDDGGDGDGDGVERTRNPPLFSASVKEETESGRILELRAGSGTSSAGGSAPLEFVDWDFAPFESKWFWMSFVVGPLAPPAQGGEGEGEGSKGAGRQLSFDVRVWSRKGKELGSATVYAEGVDGIERMCADPDDGSADERRHNRRDLVLTLLSRSGGASGAADAPASASAEDEDGGERKKDAPSVVPKPPGRSVDASLVLMHDRHLNWNEVGALRQQAKRYDIKS